jgi:hypothetical protein
VLSRERDPSLVSSMSHLRAKMASAQLSKDIDIHTQSCDRQGCDLNPAGNKTSSKLIVRDV